MFKYEDLHEINILLPIKIQLPYGMDLIVVVCKIYKCLHGNHSATFMVGMHYLVN